MHSSARHALSGSDAVDGNVSAAIEPYGVVGGGQLERLEWMPALNGIAMCQGGVMFDRLKEKMAMNQPSIIGIDLAKPSV